MKIIDVFFIILIVFTFALGAALGFGKIIRLRTRNFVQLCLTSAPLAWILLGLIIKIAPVEAFLNACNSKLLDGGNIVCTVLSMIKIETFALYLAILTLTMLFIHFVIRPYEAIFEAQNIVSNVLNATVGGVYVTVCFLGLLSVVLSIASIIPGVGEFFDGMLSGSFLKLDVSLNDYKIFIRC